MAVVTADAAEDLHVLGDTAKEVAQSLRLWGIKGQRNKIRRCPIAKYLLLRGHDVRSVGTLHVYLNPGRVVCSPKPVREFIRQFDSGDHPQLDVNAPTS